MARQRATRLTSIAASFRRLFKIAGANPVLWWDAESHRSTLALPDVWLEANGANGSTSIVNSGKLSSAWTVNGDAKISTAKSKFGGSSLYFDGTGDYISTSNVPVIGTGDFCIEGWFYPTNADANAGIFNMSANAGGLGLGTFEVSQGSLAGGNDVHLPGVGWVRTGLLPVTGVWSHIAVERYNGVLRVYQDGVVKYSSAYAGNLLYTNLAVGAYDSVANCFPGYIDNFKLTVGSATYKSTAAVGTQVFDPALLTPTSAPSPLPLPSLYQDSAGATAVTAVEQPVGRAVDQSGNARHALQATSAARPILSARKNLLTFSEQFDNAAWVHFNSASNTAPNATVAPDGTTTADLFRINSAANIDHLIYQSVTATVPAGTYTLSIRVRPNGVTRFRLAVASNAGFANRALVDVNLTNLTNTRSTGGSGFTALNSSVSSADARGFHTVTLTYSSTLSGAVPYIVMADSAGSFLFPGVVGDGLFVWGAQLELGSTATAYQRIAAATDYDTTASPLMLRFDGVDDSISSAAFAAGTLPANADVYMVVNRASNDGASVLLASSNANYIGVPSTEALDPGGPIAAGAGTPTQWVNGVQVTTRTQTNTAMGSSLVLFSAHGANLSSWTELTVGNRYFPSAFGFTGTIGAVLITPAQPDSTRARIRRALARAYQIQGVV